MTYGTAAHEIITGTALDDTILAGGGNDDVFGQGGNDLLYGLCRNYARRGYRKREPLDDEVAPEQPAALEQAIRLLVDEQVQSRDQICAAVPLASSEIEALACLPTRFLSSKPQIQLRSAKGTSGRPHSQSSQGSTAIPFPARSKP